MLEGQVIRSRDQLAKRVVEPTRPPNAVGSGELFSNLPAPNDDEGELDVGDEEPKDQSKMEGD